MKQLSEFIALLSPREVLHFRETDIWGLFCDPVDAVSGGMYCIIDEFLFQGKGKWTIGQEGIQTVDRDQVSAVLAEQAVPGLSVPQLLVDDARKATAQAAQYYFDAPDERLSIIAVTGTNGKTTTTHLINYLLNSAGQRAAALGTLGLSIDRTQQTSAIYTTPLAPRLFHTLSTVHQQHVQHLAMEVSSHAIKLDRVFGLDMDGAVLTNLSRDHLDFHGTMADYRATKLSLFQRLKPAAWVVANGDDALGREIIQTIPNRGLDYGFSEGVALRASDALCSAAGTSWKLTYQGQTIPLHTPLLGHFNIYNVLAAIGAVLQLGVEWEHLPALCSLLQPVPGRMETIDLGAGRTGIVDYAHTPDALANVLRAIRDLAPRRVITVFGCGGDRDVGKRQPMGEIASQLSDICIVTSDNPRFEDPLKIIEAIVQGCSHRHVVVEPDRSQAIAMACRLSEDGDIVLVAGKGHERYQLVGEAMVPFSDREILQQCATMKP